MSPTLLRPSQPRKHAARCPHPPANGWRRKRAIPFDNAASLPPNPPAKGISSTPKGRAYGARPPQKSGRACFDSRDMATPPNDL